MGIKLILLLAVFAGVLYSLHLLVQDYQALTAPKLLRLLFKRDINSQPHHKPTVRWKRILLHDPLQCARYFYCEVGSRPVNNEVLQGFLYMITLEPREEDKPSLEAFKTAYNLGRLSKDLGRCKTHYPLCPFDASLLFQLVQFLLKTE